MRTSFEMRKIVNLKVERESVRERERERERERKRDACQ